MTRLWDHTLESGKWDMMSYMGHKEEVWPQAPQAERPRWSQPIPSGSWVRTGAQGFWKEICPLKAGTLGLLPCEILVLVCFPPGGGSLKFTADLYSDLPSLYQVLVPGGVQHLHRHHAKG